MKGSFLRVAGLAAALCMFSPGVGCTGAAKGAPAGAVGPGEAGPACTEILATHYDQSCSADSDCTTIVEGDSCSACSLASCGNATISVVALASYTSDTAGTPGLVGDGDGGCPGCRSTVSLDINFGPFCCGGKCQLGSCSSPTDADTDAADAGDDGPAQNLMGGYFDGSCTSATGCVDGGQCVFPLGGGCDAPGQCFFYYDYPPGPECASIEALCACDGTRTNSLVCSDSWGVAPTPAVPSYACFGAAGDGSVDASPDLVEGSLAPTTSADSD